MSKDSFLFLLAILLSSLLFVGCVTRNNSTIKADNSVTNTKVYFYVESVKPREAMPDFLEVHVTRLNRLDAIKRAEIHERIMDHLSVMSEKRRSISPGDYSELLRWKKEFNHRKRVMTRLYKKFFAITGPDEVIYLSSSEALSLCSGMVLRGDFVKEEIIDDSGIITVSRHNFYRWTIIY
ncbi:MAG: hypothetical protein WC668_00765 [Patescibacteria group bacterium]|jgi:hypothetical protein